MKNAPIEPKPGQESVWDYPRPPKLEPCSKRVRIIFNGETIVDTIRAMRVLETSHPPVFYIPPKDIRLEFLSPGKGSSLCEFKGRSVYWDLKVGHKEVPRVAWSYPDPYPGFETIRDYLAFYARPMDACYVGEEQVTPQEGDFYGGWITEEIVGPFKGGPGTWSW